MQTYRPAWLSDDRDDLVQKALIRIIKRKSEGNTAFASSYLWKTAYSVVIDQIRHEQRKRETPLENVAEPALSKAELPGPDVAYATTELREALQEAPQALSDDRKLAVTLFLHFTNKLGRRTRSKWGSSRHNSNSTSKIRKTFLKTLMEPLPTSLLVFSFLEGCHPTPRSSHSNGNNHP